MMRVEKNRVVSINFKLTNDQGELLDASEADHPLAYLHGAAGILPGLERELEGKAAGEPFSVTIAPDEGFGAHRPEMLQQIPLSSFPEDSEVEPGMGFEVQHEETGEMITFRITAVADGQVTADGNHPLAGMTLHFEGSVQEIREATEEEISQGCPL